MGTGGEEVAIKGKSVLRNGGEEYAKWVKGYEKA